MTTTRCDRGHKVLACGLHVGFEQLGPDTYACRSGKCDDVPAGPRWARRGRLRRWWRRLAAALGRAMRAEVLAERRRDRSMP